MVAATGSSPLLSSFSDHFRALLLKKGMSLNELSRRSGVNTGTISRIITQAQAPQLPTVIRLARGLGVTISELLPESLLEATS